MPCMLPCRKLQIAYAYFTNELILPFGFAQQYTAGQANNINYSHVLNPYTAKTVVVF